MQNYEFTVLYATLKRLAQEHPDIDFSQDIVYCDRYRISWYTTDRKSSYRNPIFHKSWKKLLLLKKESSE